MHRRTLIAIAMSALGLAALPALAEEAAPKKGNEYLPLADFTVNLPPDGRHTGYVVIGLTIEARPDAAAALKAIFPRVREAVLERLMEMSERGEMKPGHTDALALKDNMLATITKLQPEGVHDVLITRILYT